MKPEPDSKRLKERHKKEIDDVKAAQTEQSQVYADTGPEAGVR